MGYDDAPTPTAHFMSTFPALARIVARYRRDVHHLQASASTEAISALEGHLGQSLPQGLRAFLREHNGAQLFVANFASETRPRLRQRARAAPPLCFSPTALTITGLGQATRTMAMSLASGKEPDSSLFTAHLIDGSKAQSMCSMHG